MSAKPCKVTILCLFFFSSKVPELQPCRQLCQEVIENLRTPWPAALNCSTLPSSPNLCLSPSWQTTPVSLVASPVSSTDLQSVFSPPSPYRHSSFSSINPSASMHLSSTSALSSSMSATSLRSTRHSSFSSINPFVSMHLSSTPATSSCSTVHLQSSPTITPQSTSQGLILGISLLCAAFTVYFTSAFGFLFIITPLLSAIPATHP